MQKEQLMGRLSHPYALKKNPSIPSILNGSKIDAVITGKTIVDEQIIHINNLLLTPGWHTFLVDSVQSGRTLLDTFLMNLHYYRDIGCLTLEQVPLSPEVENIHQQLITGHYLETFSNKDLEHYFIESFDFDFVWIEESTELIKNPWFSLFKQKITELKIDEQIPLISLCYPTPNETDKDYYVKI